MNTKIPAIFSVISYTLAVLWLSTMQASHAQSLDSQAAASNKSNKQAILLSTSNRINDFFNHSDEVSIKRFNQQLLEVTIGARSVFASNDGRYLFVGKVIDTQAKRDLSEQLAQINRFNKLATLDKTNQLSFPATTKELFEVTLFTDIDCGYCRRFHNNMAQYNALGIRINYLMLPRAGKNSNSYNKTLAVLCSTNPQESMNLAMQGKYSSSSVVNDTRCRSKLNKQMLLANELGITATPTILFANGEVIEGAVNPDQLLAQLKQVKVNSTK